MIPRLYFDTSVFGGIYDEEFQRDTQCLFEMVKSGKIICVYSDLTELELENAPTNVIEHFKELPNKYTEYVELNLEMNQLAEEYVKEKVEGQTSIDDCWHIACATINKVDYLVS